MTGLLARLALLLSLASACSVLEHVVTVDDDEPDDEPTGPEEEEDATESHGDDCPESSCTTEQSPEAETSEVTTGETEYGAPEGSTGRTSETEGSSEGAPETSDDPPVETTTR